MKSISLRIFLFSFFITTCTTLYADVIYTVDFHGVSRSEIRNKLEDISVLVSLCDRAPATVAALRRRAESDIPALIKVMHSYGYYDAKVTFEIQHHCNENRVLVHIQPGPVYRLASVRLIPAILPDDAPSCSVCSTLDMITPMELGLRIGKPAMAEEILKSFCRVKVLLAEQGYALAKVTNEEVIVDQAEKAVNVIIHVKTGPQVCFGATRVCGNKDVYTEFILNELAWAEGEIFNPLDIELTETALLGTNLFSSVRITYGEEANECNCLPMTVEVVEGKFRSIGLGVSYTTQWGPGLLVEWEHRNLNHRGDRLTLEMDFWAPTQTGLLAYRIPHFLCRNQDLIWLIQSEEEETRSYDVNQHTFLGKIERKFWDQGRFSYGGGVTFMADGESDDPSKYRTLIKTPVNFAYMTANSILDPTEGYEVILNFTPTIELTRIKARYLTTEFIGTTYYSFCNNDAFVLAAKMAFGSIIGSSRINIPSPERLYSGDENTLRGYRYQTVCPLNAAGDPIGGRSLLVWSLETRFHTSEKWGFVWFYEFGNVYENTLPDFSQGLLNSTGVGARYFTALGPIRLDIAFPLNRRKHLDRVCQLYFSIGQSF